MNRFIAVCIVLCLVSGMLYAQTVKSAVTEAPRGNTALIKMYDSTFNACMYAGDTSGAIVSCQKYVELNPADTGRRKSLEKLIKCQLESESSFYLFNP